MFAIEKQIFTLENDFLFRSIEVSENGLRTLSFINKTSGRDYLTLAGAEFNFELNGEKISSYTEKAEFHEVDGNVTESSCLLKFLGMERRNLADSIEELCIFFTINGLHLTVHYQVPHGVPGMRKFLTFQNKSSEIMRLDRIVWDHTVLCPGQKFSECEFFYGQEDFPASLCQFYNGTEDILRFHNPILDEGFFLASTAPGCLRNFLIYPHWNNISVGYNVSAAPSTYYLQADEKFTSDSSLTAFYTGKNINPIRNLIRTFLPPLPANEGIMYCTWLPFMKNIDESLILKLVAEAAELGFSYFTLDDGWFTDNDWAVDTIKFPNGLEVIEKAVRNAGMKFGLWFNIGTSYGAKKINEATACRTVEGKLKKLGFNTAQCPASSWREVVLAKLDELAKLYNVDYFKLDFSSIASPYGIMGYGCYANDHEHHQGFEDSILRQYQSFRYLRDELKNKHPKLIVDFSFEAFGTAAPNIAALGYSELHHVSNLSGNKTEVQDITQIRKNFYRWSRLLPPERQLLGLLTLQNERAVEYLLTSFIGAPLVSGDLRQLSSANRARVTKLSKAFQNAVKKTALTEFEVVFNNNSCDAFKRFNIDGHGIICVFNQSDEAFLLPKDNIYVNVENNEVCTFVAPQSCWMLSFET